MNENRKKKILFVITYLELGGAQKRLLNVIKGLDRDRYSPYLFAGDRGRLRDEFAAVPGLEIRLAPELKRTVSPLNDIIAFFSLYGYIRDKKIDIVHTHSPKASILARWAAYAAGVKDILYTVHGWPFHAFLPRALYIFYLWLERVSAKITKKIIVVSKKDLETGIGKRVAPRDKFRLVHHGLDVEFFDEIYRKRKAKPPSGGTVLNISSLKRQKGLDVFLNAVCDMRTKREPLKCLLLGDGPLRGDIERSISDRGLSETVFLEGWTEDIAPVLSETSLLMLTSSWEGLPVAALEAVLSGVPVVITDTGGCVDIIEDRTNGIVVKAGDTRGISDAAIEILDNYDRWAGTIAAGREKIDMSYWSAERMLGQLDDIYRTL